MGLVMGLMWLLLACYLGLHGILTGLIKSPDHPSMKPPSSCGDLQQQAGKLQGDASRHLGSAAVFCFGPRPSKLHISTWRFRALTHLIIAASHGCSYHPIIVPISRVRDVLSYSWPRSRSGTQLLVLGPPRTAGRLSA